MRAVVRDRDGVALRDVPAPRAERPDEVVVQVAVAGLCRTDLYVADGRIACRWPRILGHEFSGTVTAAGAGVTHLQPGDRVTAMPMLGCSRCADCQQNRICADYRMLGVDQDGAFAEYVLLTGSNVYRLPDAVSWQAGAYVEPVAAALAITEAGLDPHSRGLVHGDGRFARLACHLLQLHGFRHVDVGVPRGQYDFVVETDARRLSDAMDAVRPGGTVVLKSRCPEPVPLDVTLAIRKRLRLQAVNYGPFDTALHLVAELPLAEVLGETWPLHRWSEAFESARQSEARKLFLRLSA
ncbi:MAG TPA: alcohol dehydrogenase catalytic domain-containing protein [Candidatus Xenobia bacterium]|jgi:L-iditol 2-dehydrogenase